MTGDALAAGRARWETAAIAGGIVGSLALLAGSVVAAIAYTGTQGERYNPLNHFVSELGERGVSALGGAFNVGLILGGLGFVVFMVGLAITGTDRLRYVYAPVGVVAGVAGTLVGVFPMDEAAIHGFVALAFFNLGWIAVALASVPVAVGHDRRFPRWLAAVGALTVVAFLAFLYEFRVDPRIADTSLGSPAARPDVWLLTALEWAVIVGILGWTFLAAVTWRRSTRGHGA